MSTGKRSRKSIEAELAAMGREELLAFAAEVAHENVRLRTIFNAVARADEGTGAHALVALNAKRRGLSVDILVCRPNGDEEALARDVRGAFAEFLKRYEVALDEVAGEADGVARLGGAGT